MVKINNYDMNNLGVIFQYFSLFDDALKYHSSELSHLTEKPKIASLLLSELTVFDGVKHDSLLTFSQWLFMDLNRKIFVEHQCSINVVGNFQTTMVNILLREEFFFLTKWIF